MFKILDLFSGAGGFSYGLEMNGNFESVLATDFNGPALETFKRNHPKADVILGDVTSIEHKEKLVEKAKELGVNMIIGGPPCQGFSMKGKKLGLKDPRNFLFLEYYDLVKRISPEIFIIENVKALVSSADGYFLKEIIELFSDLGYKINWTILKASDFGVPQRRERAFIIGSKSGVVPFPEKLNKIVTVEDAISDLRYLSSGEISNGEYINGAKTQYQKLMRRKSSKLYNHESTSHSLDAVKRMSMIPIKGNKFDLPESMRTNQKFHTTWSRLHWDKVSPTIDTRFDTPSNGQNIHPELNRAITPREAARIQSFPDAFEFVGRKTEICKQIGNAVPPLLAKAIADSIEKFYSKSSKDIFSEDDITLINGDTYNISVEKLPFLDAIITDPPYNISKENNFSTLNGNRKGVDFGEWDKNFDLTGWIEKFYAKLKPGGTILIFGSYLFTSHICDEISRLGGDVKDLIKWVKTNPMPRNIDRRYVQDTEYAIWAVKPGGKWTFNKGGEKYRRANYESPVVSGKERTEHPTQKSLKVMKELIETHTNIGDVIVDPFMGSGTTGVAAKELNRKFVGIELEKKYFEISKNRIFNKK